MKLNEAIINLIEELNERKIHLGNSFYLETVYFTDDSTPKICLRLFLEYYLDKESKQYDRRRAEYREIKKMFGGLKEEGLAPNVKLVGHIFRESSMGLYEVTLDVVGAFQCTLVERFDVELTDKDITENKQRAASYEREADKLRSAVTKTESRWSCDSNLAKQIDDNESA